MTYEENFGFDVERDLGRVVRMKDHEYKRRPRFNNKCRHQRIELDPEGEIVTCRDCEKQVGAFWALGNLVDNWHTWVSNLLRWKDELKEIDQRLLHLKAARKVERAWRSRTTVPCCPHCDEAIFPEDGLGNHVRGRELAAKAREKNKP